MKTKKILTIFFTFILALCIVGCGEAKTSASVGKNLNNTVTNLSSVLENLEDISYDDIIIEEITPLADSTFKTVSNTKSLQKTKWYSVGKASAIDAPRENSKYVSSNVHKGSKIGLFDTKKTSNTGSSNCENGYCARNQSVDTENESYNSSTKQNTTSYSPKYVNNVSNSFSRDALDNYLSKIENLYNSCADCISCEAECKTARNTLAQSINECKTLCSKLADGTIKLSDDEIETCNNSIKQISSCTNRLKTTKGNIMNKCDVVSKCKNNYNSNFETTQDAYQKLLEALETRLDYYNECNDAVNSICDIINKTNVDMDEVLKNRSNEEDINESYLDGEESSGSQRQTISNEKNPQRFVLPENDPFQNNDENAIDNNNSQQQDVQNNPILDENLDPNYSVEPNETEEINEKESQSSMISKRNTNTGTQSNNGYKAKNINSVQNGAKSQEKTAFNGSKNRFNGANGTGIRNIANKNEVRNTENKNGIRNITNKNEVRNTENSNGVRNVVNRNNERNAKNSTGIRNIANKNEVRNTENSNGVRNVANKNNERNAKNSTGIRNIANKNEVRNTENKNGIRNIANKKELGNAENSNAVRNVANRNNERNAKNSTGIRNVANENVLGNGANGIYNNGLNNGIYGNGAGNGLNYPPRNIDTYHTIYKNIDTYAPNYPYVPNNNSNNAIYDNGVQNNATNVENGSAASATENKNDCINNENCDCENGEIKNSNSNDSTYRISNTNSASLTTSADDKNTPEIETPKIENNLSPLPNPYDKNEISKQAEKMKNDDKNTTMQSGNEQDDVSNGSENKQEENNAKSEKNVDVHTAMQKNNNEVQIAQNQNKNDLTSNSLQAKNESSKNDNDVFFRHAEHILS